MRIDMRIAILTIIIGIAAPVWGQTRLVPFYQSGTATTVVEFDTAEAGSAYATSKAITTTLSGSNIMVLGFTHCLSSKNTDSIKSNVNGHFTKIDSILDVSSRRFYVWKLSNATAGVHTFTAYISATETFQFHVVSLKNAGAILDTEKTNCNGCDSLGRSFTTNSSEMMVTFAAGVDSTYSGQITYGSGQTERTLLQYIGSTDLEGSTTTKPGTGGAFTVYHKFGTTTKSRGGKAILAVRVGTP